MYDELVKRLWECASGECFNCSQYTETTNASVCSKELMKQAADAIEELSKPRWIPVTERLPEDNIGDTLLCSAWEVVNVPKPQTNADRIRAMSDEELAEWASAISSEEFGDKKDWLDWLKQEAI